MVHFPFAFPSVPLLSKTVDLTKFLFDKLLPTFRVRGREGIWKPDLPSACDTNTEDEEPSHGAWCGGMGGEKSHVSLEL